MVSLEGCRFASCSANNANGANSLFPLIHGGCNLVDRTTCSESCMPRDVPQNVQSFISKGAVRFRTEESSARSVTVARSGHCMYVLLMQVV